VETLWLINLVSLSRLGIYLLQKWVISLVMANGPSPLWFLLCLITCPQLFLKFLFPWRLLMTNKFGNTLMLVTWSSSKHMISNYHRFRICIGLSLFGMLIFHHLDPFWCGDWCMKNSQQMRIWWQGVVPSPQCAISTKIMLKLPFIFSFNVSLLLLYGLGWLVVWI
jgi:hypothetical protein